MHDDSTSSHDPAPRGADAALDASGDDVTFSQWQDASDGDLILYTRAGDGAAYGELWRRHARAGRTVARSFTSSLDPDDLVQESFAKIYQALQKGGGPTGAFRPYLFTTIRNTASAWGRARREASIDTLESFEDPASRDEETMAALDRSLTATAFRSLPTRWQEVLWYCEVEQMTPQQVAPLLAMKPNAVAALAYRAREGLRQAWIQAHIAAVPEDSEHRWTIERIGSYTRGSLGKRDTAKIESHLDGCARCTIVAAEAKEVGSRIALVLLPLAAGTAGATGYLAWMQTGSHAALTTAAMPAGVIGGHGMSVAAPVDPTVLSSLVTSTGGAAPGATAASASGSAGTAGGGAASAGSVSAGAVSAGAVTTGIVSAVVAVVAAGAVAMALAFSPAVITAAPQNDTGQSVAPEDSRDGAPSAGAPSADAPSADPAPAPGPSASAHPETETPADPDTATPGPSSPSDPTSAPPLDPAVPAKPDPETPVEPSLPASPNVITVDQGTHDALYPRLQGTAEPDSIVTIRRGDELLAQTTTAGDGMWLAPDLLTLPVGDSEITVVQTTPEGSSEPTTMTVTLRAAPSVLDPVDGGILFASDLRIVLDDAFPLATVAGSVDGRSMFTCQYDASGTAPACSWNDGTEWISLGLGWHTIAVAYTDGGSRVGPARDSRVFVVFPTGTVAETATAGDTSSEPDPVGGSDEEQVDGLEPARDATPATGAPTDDTPAAQTPTDEAPAAQTPADPSPAAPMPAEGTPEDDTTNSQPERPAVDVPVSAATSDGSEVAPAGGPTTTAESNDA